MPCVDVVIQTNDAHFNLMSESSTQGTVEIGGRYFCQKTLTTKLQTLSLDSNSPEDTRQTFAALAVEIVSQPG